MDVLSNRIPGDLIEAGVWRGGTSIFMRAVLKAMAVTDRRLWVADSFEGLPTTESALQPKEARAIGSLMPQARLQKTSPPLSTRFDRISKGMACSTNKTVFVKGWFQRHARYDRERAFRDRPDRRGFVFLHARLPSRALSQARSRWAYVIIDDYGLDSWTECRKAVDEYRATHGIDEELIIVDSQCAYWKRRHTGQGVSNE